MNLSMSPEKLAAHMPNMWINAFTVIRPSEEPKIDIAKTLLGAAEIPGTTLVRVSIT